LSVSYSHPKALRTLPGRTAPCLPREYYAQAARLKDRLRGRDAAPSRRWPVDPETGGLARSVTLAAGQRGWRCPGARRLLLWSPSEFEFRNRFGCCCFFTVLSRMFRFDIFFAWNSFFRSTQYLPSSSFPQLCAIFFGIWIWVF